MNADLQSVYRSRSAAAWRPMTIKRDSHDALHSPASPFRRRRSFYAAETSIYQDRVVLAMLAVGAHARASSRPIEAP